MGCLVIKSLLVVCEKRFGLGPKIIFGVSPTVLGPCTTPAFPFIIHVSFGPSADHKLDKAKKELNFNSDVSWLSSS